jgi:hypothetical protein
MTIATVGVVGHPWAASVFFATDDHLNFFFLSESKTRHGRDLAGNSHVAIAINDDPSDWRQIKGVQMEGEVSEVRSPQDKAHALSIYLKKFPFVQDFIKSPLHALDDLKIAGKAFSATLYVFRPRNVYLLDNKTGFSNRLSVPIQ